MRYWPPAATVQEASTGEEVLQAVQVLPPDVIFLDLGLPEVDGIEVTYRLRRFYRHGHHHPFGRAAESDKIVALDSGADDYLTKPCQPEQLLERVLAALLRETLQHRPVFVAGDLAVDLNRQTVQIWNSHVELTPNEYELLKVLVLNAGKLLTQRQLAD